MIALALLPNDPAFNGSFDDCVYPDIDDGFEGSVCEATGHRAAAQRFAANTVGVEFSEMSRSTCYGRFLTRQEIWDDYGRDRFIGEYLDSHPGIRYIDDQWRYSDHRVAKVPNASDVVPGDWMPIERDPVWEFCKKTDAGATKIYVFEVKES
jgi:hypothetical protein